MPHSPKPDTVDRWETALVARARREVNRRGHGGQLREEILRAAYRLLAHSSRDAITLRAIAREAGIAAPSIYPHFPDRNAILDAVIARTFDQLGQACETAAADAPSTAARVRAICAAYIAFARDQSIAYQILFEHSGNPASGPRAYETGTRAFQILVDALTDAVADGSSTSTDPVLDAQALWAAIHGVLTLIPSTPGFPWRAPDAIVERTIEALAHLHD